jgi:N-acetylglucosamine malate deacetylase 2
VILVGLQASGKSTYGRQRYGGTHALVSRDLFRSHPRPARRQRELLEGALRAGCSVLVDNTSPTVADRAAVIEVARALGARVTCCFFPPDVRASIARNGRREGKARVPVVGILATAKRLVPPALDEGFDRLVEVRADGAGGFEEREIAASATRADPARRAASGALARRGALLIVAAHPDDETLGAGGLLAHRGPLRGRATIVHLTDGAPRERRWWPGAWSGPPPADATAYAALRRRELAAALAVVGLAPEAARSLGAADQEAALHLAPLALALRTLVVELAPAAVLTHPYEGGHPDHDAAAFASRAAVALLAREGARTPRLCEMASYHGAGGALVTGAFLPVPGAPELVWRLPAAEREAKARMLAAFESQRAVLAAFRRDEERFRRAPSRDLTAPPHPGPLWYERLGFSLTGARFRELARRAQAELRLAG